MGSAVFLYTLEREGERTRPWRPGHSRERTEGERPGFGPMMQRWEAVFRRERRPGSLDRFFRADQWVRRLAMQGEDAVIRRFLPAHPIFSKESLIMKEHFARKVTLAGLLVAVAVVGSTFSFPVFSSKCAPVQHMVNILCAVLLEIGRAHV